MYREYVKRCRSNSDGITGGTLEPSNISVENLGNLGMNNGLGSSQDSIDESQDTLPAELLSTVASEKVRINNAGLLGKNGKHRKLVLHFDIRNTVLVADSVTNVSVEQALNSFLTGVTWGKEVNGEWHWHSNELSLTPPTDDTMTFYKYLEGMFVQTTNDRTRLRLATGDFTHSKIGEIFHSHFQNHMELLRWKHHYNHDDHSTLTMAGQDGQRYNYIVPSVYKCIHHLVETKRDFAIVFRTYGLDAPNVITSLEYGLQGNHPGFPKALNLDVNRNVGLVKRDDGSKFVFEVFDSEQAAESEIFTGDRDIYNMLCQRTGISGFRDDIHYWLNNGYHHSTSKPLFIDPFDLNVQHIFFDDNIRTFEDDSIVDLRIFDSRDAKTARTLTKGEAGQFDNLCMVQADLIRSIETEDYYLEKVKQCEENYSNFLERYNNKFSRCISLQQSL